MYAKFVKTSNVDRFLAATATIEQRAAPEACIILGQGQAGYGKTATGEFWATQKNAILIRLKAACTPHWFLTDLVQSLGEQAPANSCEKLFNQAVGYLAKNPQPIVVDEVENGLSHFKVLETIRDISDTVDIPVVFLGREYVWGALTRHKQFRTRIGARADFGPASLSDVRKCVEELCEARLDDAVVKRIEAESEGHIREIVKAIANAERIGRKSGKTVTIDAIGDKPLVHEWQRSPKKAAA